jgi:hypothetical protein
MGYIPPNIATADDAMPPTLPPFRLAPTGLSAAASWSTMVAVHGQAECCETNDRRVGSAPNGRARLAGLDPHMHCSVIGTCLTTAELRKIMARFVDIQDASDVEVHHEAVRLTA